MTTTAASGDRRATNVTVTDDELSVVLADGRRVAVPLVWFPRLLHASSGQRGKWQLIGDGVGIRWPELDADVSVAGLLQPIAGLHESVLGTDPTGREMRPRERDAAASGVREEVVVLRDVPPPCAGAPIPAIVADEYTLTLAYFARPDDRLEERVAVVHFEPTLAHRFGTPNDETLASHPLWSRGLEPYAAHEVSPSSWLAEIVQRNSIHSAHRAEHFAKWRHFVFTFHDSTFECIAERCTVPRHQASTEKPLQLLLETVANARRERPNPSAGA